MATFNKWRVWRLITFILVFIVCGISQLLSTNAFAQDSLSSIDSAKLEQELPLKGLELSIGVAALPPFSLIRDSLSDPQGIDVEIVLELQKRTGFKIKNNQIDTMTFSEMLKLCAEGKIDIGGGGVSLTQARSKIYDFSPSFYTTFTVLVAPKNSPIRDFPDLDNKSIAAELGTTAADVMPPQYNVRLRVDNTSSNFMSFYRVSRQLSDAMLIDEPMAVYYLQDWKASNLEIKQLVADSATRMGLLFRKNSKANPYLAKAMEDMIADGTMDRILEKYTGKNYKEAVGPFYEENLTLAGISLQKMEQRYQSQGQVATRKNESVRSEINNFQKINEFSHNNTDAYFSDYSETRF